MNPQTTYNFSDARLLIVGDIMLDRYWMGDSTRLSPEAPVPVVLVQSVRDTPGGAANVAVNAANLGPQVSLLSVSGDDPEGRRLEEMLQESGVRCTVLRQKQLQTIVKLRIIARHQQVVRADFEQRPAGELLLPLVDLFKQQAPDHQTVIFSDYGKGGLVHLAQMMTVARGHAMKILVDPKGSDYRPYHGASVVTPNRAEFAQVAGIWSDESDFERRAFRLRDELELGALLVTRSEEGMSLFLEGRHVRIQARAKDVFDVSGAGDTVIAILGAAIGAGHDIEHAAHIANAGAGVVVGKMGTCPITLDELIESL